MKFYFSNFLVSKFPTLQKYKPGIEFLARLFFLAVLGLASKKLFWLISDAGGTFTLPLISGFNPIEALRNSLIAATAFFLQLFGYTSFIAGWVVGIPQVAAVKVETPCLGINVCLVFIVLIVAYPSAMRGWLQALYLVVGVLIIQIFNIARMVAMVFVIKNRYQLPIEHHDLFNMVIYAVIFALFYLFISLSTLSTVADLDNR